MSEPQTQEDEVKKRNLERGEVLAESVTDVLNIPGIKELHLQDRESISEVLQKTLLNILKARPNIISFTYNVGKNIEVTYRPVQ